MPSKQDRSDLVDLAANRAWQALVAKYRADIDLTTRLLTKWPTVPEPDRSRGIGRLEVLREIVEYVDMELSKRVREDTRTYNAR